jgi:uncharacterized protein YgiM (DUF1202 family)
MMMATGVRQQFEFGEKMKIKNSLNFVLVILTVIFASSVACSTPSERESTRATPVSLTSAPPPSVSPSPQQQQRTVSIESRNKKAATVIAENAELRKTANSKSEVVKSLQQGSSVEVIRQKGAWFYVSAAGGGGESKGWMYGNTIRLDSGSSSSSSSEVTNSSPTYPANPVKKKTPVYKEAEQQQTRSINPSGATAKCRDGTLSYSKNRRGTCSHHGGVAVWY